MRQRQLSRLLRRVWSLLLVRWGGILAPWVYLAEDAPEYRQGHAILFAFLFGSWGVCAGLIGYIKRENWAREMGRRDWVLDGLSSEEKVELSSRHPGFRYVV